MEKRLRDTGLAIAATGINVCGFFMHLVLN